MVEMGDCSPEVGVRGEQGLLSYSADFSSNAIARGLRSPSRAGKAFRKGGGGAGITKGESIRSKQ